MAARTFRVEALPDGKPRYPRSVGAHIKELQATKAVKATDPRHEHCSRGRGKGPKHSHAGPAVTLSIRHRFERRTPRSWAKMEVITHARDPY